MPDVKKNVMLATTVGYYLAEVDCKDRHELTDEDLEPLKTDMADNIVFDLPDRHQTCVATIIQPQMSRIDIPDEELKSKGEEEQKLERRQIREKKYLETLGIVNYPGAEIKAVNLEPETRKIAEVVIYEEDEGIRRDVEKALEELGLNKGGVLRREEGFDKKQKLLKKFSKLSVKYGRIIMPHQMNEVDGAIHISIASLPIPSYVSVIDIKTGTRLDAEEHVIKTIIASMLDTDEKKVKFTFGFMSGSGAITKRVAEKIAGHRDIRSSKNNYSLLYASATLDGVLKVFVASTPAPKFKITKRTGFSDGDLNRLDKLFEQPVNDIIFEEEIRKLDMMCSLDGFTLYLLQKEGEDSTVHLELTKVPKWPTAIRVRGDFPPNEHDLIVAAFGETPKDGWSMSELLGNSADIQSDGLAGVMRYLTERGYKIDRLLLDAEGTEIIIDVGLAKWEVGKIVVMGPKSTTPSKKEIEEAQKRLSAEIEKLVKEYGEGARYISNDTVERISQAARKVLHTGVIRPIIVDDNGKAVINLVADQLEPEKKLIGNLGYSRFGMMVSFGYQYNNNRGTTVGGDISWQGIPGDATNLMNWDTQNASLRLFIDKQITESDSIGVSIYYFHADYGAVNNKTAGTRVSYSHAFGDNFSISLGTTLEYMSISGIDYGYTGTPVRGKEDLSICYHDSRNKTCIQGSASVGTANYQEVGAFYEHRMPLGVVYLDEKSRKEAERNYVKAVKGGEKQYAPTLKFRIGGSKQFGKVPYFEQLTLLREAPFPVTFANPSWTVGTHLFGGSVVFEQPVNDWLSMLLGIQAYMIGHDFTWGAGGGVSVMGMNIWVGYGNNGLIIYVSPADLFEKMNLFGRLKKGDNMPKEVNKL